MQRSKINRHHLTLHHTLPEERAHRLLRLRRQAGKQLSCIKASIRDELLRSPDDPRCHVTLQCLGFERLRNEDEASRGL